MIDRINLNAISYIVIQNLDMEVIEELECEDGPDTTDVVRNVIETESSSWVFYYVEECSQELTEPAKQIPYIIPMQKFVDKAEEYAEKDKPVIDLTNPASQDWMSEDPMSRPREEYQDRVNSIKSAILSSLSDLMDLSKEDQTEVTENIVGDIDPLQWELNRVRNGNQNKASDERIAELYLATGPNSVVDLLSQYADHSLIESEVEREPLESYRLTDAERKSRMNRLSEDGFNG